eukprot:m.44325 g.44325  ORF g.44325 m.44325 type:complete len:269 (-) comp46974_c0_seq1:156-962(-)
MSAQLAEQLTADTQPALAEHQPLPEPVIEDTFVEETELQELEDEEDFEGLSEYEHAPDHSFEDDCLSWEDDCLSRMSKSTRKTGPRAQDHPIVSHGILNTLVNLTDAHLRHTDTQRLTRVVLNSNKNTRGHHQTDGFSAQTKHERDQDRNIRTALATGLPVSKEAAGRAAQQYRILCQASQAAHPRLFNTVVQAYSSLTTRDGLLAVPRASRTDTSNFRTASSVPVAHTAISRKLLEVATPAAVVKERQRRSRHHRGARVAHHIAVSA